jgi:hypothetical protein
MNTKEISDYINSEDTKDWVQQIFRSYERNVFNGLKLFTFDNEVMIDFTSAYRKIQKYGYDYYNIIQQKWYQRSLPINNTKKEKRIKL